MRLVNDHRVVTVQHPITLNFAKQDAIRHYLDQRALADLIGKAHLVAYKLTQCDPELFSNADCHRLRRQPSRLRMADQPGNAAASL